MTCLRAFAAMLIVISSMTGCTDLGTAQDGGTRIVGQVFLISHPGPVPIGWVAPPLEQKSTIQVLDVQRRTVREAVTNLQGRFEISVQPGTYYLRVKESPLPAETGPFIVEKGETLTARAHFDSGMR